MTRQSLELCSDTNQKQAVGRGRSCFRITGVSASPTLHPKDSNGDKAHLWLCLGKSSSFHGGLHQAGWETQARSVSGAAEKDLSHSLVPLPPDTDLIHVSPLPEAQPGAQVSFQIKGACTPGEGLLVLKEQRVLLVDLAQLFSTCGS